ncbi:hypothetical protein PN36_07050 [Candidatus Thiomargarita nelsonii]|uniref:SpoVT-AbrB domain-containing protein n=1 Tax=Candidatus Thiomargarita nelsonii TaxID=1003181 RepID=A0A0A6PQC8_9GAMM|nr:hypothetical protein PN36_07050 [Candidatus Thiomargarita nelsonii]
MEQTIKINPSGSLTLPKEYLKILGIFAGEKEVRLQSKGSQVVMFSAQKTVETAPKLSPQEAVKNAQAIVRQYIPAGRSLADELIAERRWEAANE